MKSQVIDRIFGCLFGQAIGDALGLGSEFMDKKEVKKYYPDKLKRYDQIIQDEHRIRWNIGAWTDDTDMMLCLMDAFNNGGFLYERAAHNFKIWFNGIPMGIGRHVAKVLCCSDYEDAPFEASKIMWISTKCNCAANGALMRTSIMGLWEEYNRDWVEQACRLTHYDPRCILSCHIASFIINQLVWHSRLLSVDEVLSMTADAELASYIKLAYDSPNISDLELAKQPGIGYTYRTLCAALWCYWHSDSFESGLIDIVNEGGDADTNAAIACAILGARFGYNSIPIYYVNNLHRSDYYMNRCNDFVKIVLGS